MAQCEAKSKRSGERCKRPATPGRSVCATHGGKSPRGLAHPSTRHGRFSRDLPTRLLSDYHDALGDPDLLALNEELSILVVREKELLRRLDTGESGAIWAALLKAWDEFQRATRAEDKKGMAAALGAIEAALRRADDDRSAWREWQAASEARRRLADTERRRRVDAQRMVTEERALLFVAAILDVLRSHIADARTLAAIAADLQRLTGPVVQDGHDLG